MSCQIISESTQEVVATPETGAECDEWFAKNDPTYLYHWHKEN